jgi:hypothetical protein
MKKPTVFPKPMIHPEIISRFKKERFLLEMPEGEFRDRVIRPIFFRMGFNEGRDLCGPTECGKDAIFTIEGPLGIKEYYAVQTKKGRLNMSRITTQNVTEAITQLKTAASTAIPLIASKEKVYPSKVLLCVSGKVNDKARNHIVDELRNTPIRLNKIHAIEEIGAEEKS